MKKFTLKKSENKDARFPYWVESEDGYGQVIYTFRDKEKAERCLRRLNDEGWCDHCGDRGNPPYYQVDEETLCSECHDEFRIKLGE